MYFITCFCVDESKTNALTAARLATLQIITSAKRHFTKIGAICTNSIIAMQLSRRLAKVFILVRKR